MFVRSGEGGRERKREMKVQCDVCERAEATVLCCADEAALCERCDEKVHAANKLAGKHQRVALLSRSSSHIPSCDICQVPVSSPLPSVSLSYYHQRDRERERERSLRPPPRRGDIYSASTPSPNSGGGGAAIRSWWWDRLLQALPSTASDSCRLLAAKNT